jgi:hypothetical protein
MSFIVGGFIGGLLRGGVGIFKYITSYKDVEIRPYYFIGSVALSGVVGCVTAWALSDIATVFLEVGAMPVSFAIIAGYAGGDLIENIFKIVAKEPNLFEVGKKIKEISNIEEKIEKNIEDK